MITRTSLLCRCMQEHHLGCRRKKRALYMVANLGVPTALKAVIIDGT